MSLRTFIFIAWGAWGVYWLLAATGAKASARNRRARPPSVLLVTALVLLRVFKADLTVHSPILQVIGVIVLGAGLALAVWARIYLGRNWGMPMTQRQEPELVTSGPYRFVRHPIYSGLLLAILGTALATNISLLIALVPMGVYFLYSATVEECTMTAAFPATYPSYRTRTKKLIPFVL